jgi:hypothetical protein
VGEKRLADKRLQASYFWVFFCINQKFGKKAWMEIITHDNSEGVRTYIFT